MPNVLITLSDDDAQLLGLKAEGLVDKYSNAANGYARAGDRNNAADAEALAFAWARIRGAVTFATKTDKPPVDPAAVTLEIDCGLLVFRFATREGGPQEFTINTLDDFYGLVDARKTAVGEVLLTITDRVRNAENHTSNARAIRLAKAICRGERTTPEALVFFVAKDAVAPTSVDADCGRFLDTGWHWVENGVAPQHLFARCKGPYSSDCEASNAAFRAGHAAICEVPYSTVIGS